MNKILYTTSIILIILFVITLSTLSYFPIYPDEIGALVWLSRTGFDFPMHVNLLPACESFLQPLAKIWYVPGIAKWLLHGFINHLQTLRWMGLLFYILLAGTLTYVLVNKTRQSVVIGLGAVLSILSVGVLPAFLVTNRQEQIILFCLIILFFLFNTVTKQKKDSLTKTMLVTLAFYLCVAFILYIHPKTLLLTPVILLVAYQIFSRFKNNAVTLLFFAVLIAQILANHQAWVSALACSQAPKVNNLLNSFNINPVEIVTHPANFFIKLKDSYRHEYKFLNQAVFQASTDIHYLPALTLKTKEHVANFFIKLNLTLWLIVLMCSLIRHYYADILKKAYLSKRLLFILLFCCAAATTLLNLTKTWYDVGYFWAVMSIVTVFYCADYFDRILKSKIGRGVILYLMLTALFSLCVFNIDFREKFINGYAGPGILLSNFNAREYQATVSSAAKACSIDPEKSSGLVVDDYTYLYFKEATYPILITYINLHTETNQVPGLIKKNHINAIITRCSSLSAIPGLNKKYTVRVGNICCVPERYTKMRYFEGVL